MATVANAALGEEAASKMDQFTGECWGRQKVPLRLETRDLQGQSSEQFCDFPLATLDNPMEELRSLLVE